MEKKQAEVQGKGKERLAQKKMTQQAYQKMTKQASPPTRSYLTIPTAFAVGGLICVLGQALMGLYQSMGLEKEPAGTAASVTLVFLSALFTGLKLYDKLAKYAGAGTLVPITGFANAMVSPALEFKSEGLVLGLGAKLFTIAGPVIVYGVSAAALYGVIVYLFGLY